MVTSIAVSEISRTVDVLVAARKEVVDERGFASDVNDGC
jgi:hypothetical protein